MIPEHGDVMVQVVLIYALNELRDLVNVGKNLTDKQIAFIAGRLASEYGYFKMEEIKYVLHRGVEREKLFDRLDPNIVLKWFAAYDDERTAEAVALSDRESAQTHGGAGQGSGAVSWDSYVDSLWNLALYADPRAVELLSQIAETASPPAKPLTSGQRHQKELDFKQYYYNQYLKGKK